MNSSSNCDQFLKQIKTSNYYCQSLNFDLKFHNIQQINIKISSNRQNQFIAKIPQIKFYLSTQIVQKLTKDISKSKKTINGLISAYQNTKFKHKMQKIHYFNQNDQQDIGVWQQAQDAFCVGFIIQKQGNYQNFNKRLIIELKKCLQKKFQQIVYAKNNKQHQSLSSLNPIQKILYKHFRFFLVFQSLKNNSLLVNRIMYYPDSKFIVKPIKLTPSKFTANKLYEQVMSFKNRYDYGYLSLSNNSKTKQVRFLLIDKFDPQLPQNPPPIIGVWISAQKFQSKQQLKNYSWAVIMQYLRSPSLKNKLSINIPKTGILFTIQKPQKITAYIFQIPDQTKWTFKYQPENTFKLPQQYSFTDQQIILEEDKQQSDIESIQNRSLMKNNNNIFNGYLPENSNQHYTVSYTTGVSGISQPCDLSKSSVQNKSVKSNDQKDLQIKFLKKQLQFYKDRCQSLQKLLNSPATLQMQAMQMFNPMTNPLANPLNNPMVNSHLAFNNPMYYQSLQQVNLANQQLGMYSNINNQFNGYPPLNQNDNLRNSNASSNYNKILNESQIFEQQIQSPPQPVQIRKQLAFNKKKTFEDEIPSNKDQDLKKTNLKRNQSCPAKYKTSQIQNQNPTQNRRSTAGIPQFPSQQDVQTSQNSKKHYVQYDYKNISFSQQNSFENQLNSTHKFASFESLESQIFAKSPDFKKQYNNDKGNGIKDNKGNLTDKVSNLYNYHQFSFDRKDDQFASSKNSKPSPTKIQSKFQYQFDEQTNKNQKYHIPTKINHKTSNDIISKMQQKYTNKYPEVLYKNTKQEETKNNIKNFSNQHLKGLSINDSKPNSVDEHYQLNQNYKKLKSPDDKPTSQDQQNKKHAVGQKKYTKISQRKDIQISQSLNRKLQQNSNRKIQETYKQNRQNNQIIKKQQKKIQGGLHNKGYQNQNRKIAASTVKQKPQNSDSQSDQQYKSIAMRYKK